MKNLSYALVLLLLLTTSVTAQTDFDRGNQHYEAKSFDSAAIAYEKVLDTGVESAPLYYNLGNAYFRQGDLGHAVFNYLKAQRLNPADEDIAANLEFARRFTSVQMEGVQLNPISSLMQSIVAPYRLSQLAWLSSILFIVTFIILILRYGFVFRGPLVKTGLILSLVLLLTCSILTTFKYNHDYLTRRAVVIAEECIVRTGPSELSEKELDGAPGLIVEILSESGEYYNVLFENKRRGWVHRDLVAVV